MTKQHSVGEGGAVDSLQLWKKRYLRIRINEQTFVIGSELFRFKQSFFSTKYIGL